MQIFLCVLVYYTDFWFMEFKTENYEGFVICQRVDQKSHCASIYNNGMLVKMIAGDIKQDGSNNAFEKSKIFIKMIYVVQCFISDKTGTVVKITDFTTEQLNSAYEKACSFYGAVLPSPDNGRYEDYTL